MRESDTGPFVALLRDVFGLYPSAKALTEGQVAMFFRAVAKHPIEAVQAALDAHVKDPQRGRFPPLPADVIAQIEGSAADDGRPGPEEAWATALQGRDEAASVVWTAETAQAWGVARPVLELGDDVGARMAFREAYGRMVDAARRARRPVEWLASLGFDPEQRQVAIAAGVAAGKLPHTAMVALPAPDGASMLVGDASGMPPHVRERLCALADRLRAQDDAPSWDAEAKAETERLKADAAERVARYEGDAS